MEPPKHCTACVNCVAVLSAKVGKRSRRVSDWAPTALDTKRGWRLPWTKRDTTTARWPRARRFLASNDAGALGRALRGQLRFRAGDLEPAERDLNAAIESADQASRPALQLSLAELLIAKGDWPAASEILRELKPTPLASQACAVEHRFLTKSGRHAEAKKVLAEGRAAHPEDMLLLALEVGGLTKEKRFAEARELLEERRQLAGDSIALILLMSETHQKAGDSQSSIDLLVEAARQYPEEVALRVRLAERMLEERQFDEVGKVLADLKGNPSVPPTMLDYLMARAAALQGDPARAEAILRRAADGDPDNPTLKFLLGRMEADKGNLADASRMLEESLSGGLFRQQKIQALFDTFLRFRRDRARRTELLAKARHLGQRVAPLRRRLIRLLARREKWDALRQEIDALLAEDPSEKNVALVVSLQRSMKDTAAAEALVARSLERFPESVSLQELKVSLLIERKELVKADALLAELLRKKPSEASLHLLRVHSYLEADRQADARKALELAWKTCPGDAALAALRVQLLLRDGKADEALAFAEEASQRHPSLPNAEYIVARMYEVIGKPKKTLELLEQLVDKEPTLAKACHHYVRMLVELGQTDGFAEKVDRLILANPTDPTLIGILAEYHALRNDVAGTEAALAKLEALRATGPRVDYLRAVIHFAKGDLDKAEQALKTVLVDPGSHVPSTFIMARVRARQNRREEALALVTQVCQRRPNLIMAQLMRAQLLIRAERLKEAESICRDVLKNQRPGGTVSPIAGTYSFGRRRRRIAKGGARVGERNVRGRPRQGRFRALRADSAPRRRSRHRP